MAEAHYSTCVKKGCLIGKAINHVVWDQVGVN
jgi:hypothetical protein